jgi:Bacterial Ig domain/Lamin Tail Domain
MRIPTLGALTLAAAAAVVALPTAANAVAPTAAADTVDAKFQTAKVINVLANDTNPDSGESLTVTGKTNGAHGTVSCTTAGDCTYTPDTGWVGNDTFTYTLSASGSPVETATGTVSVRTVKVSLITLSSTPANLVATKDTHAPTHTVNGLVTTTNSVPVAGIPVQLWKKSTGETAFSLVATRTSNSQGKVSVADLAPTNHTSYQWKSEFKDSAVRSVDVTPFVTTSYDNKKFAKGQTFTVSGVAGPVAQGQNVVLQLKGATGWTTVQTKQFGSPAADHSAAYSFDPVTHAVSGSFLYRVVVPEVTEQGRLKGTSGQSTVEVYDAQVTGVQPSNADEYVTVKNTGKVTFNLKDWTLSDDDSNVTLPKRLVAPGGIVRIHTFKGTNNSKNLYLRRANPVWGNSGTVELNDNKPFLVDDLVYP